MSQMEKDLILILPQIIVLLTAVGALIIEMLHRPRGALWFSVAGMLAAGILSTTRTGWQATVFSETFRIGPLTHWSVIILAVGNILFMLLARAELRGNSREGAIYSLLTFSALGAMLMAGSGDLMFIVLGILLLGISGFALAAWPKTDPATEGAMKYFIYGSVTGAIMIFGFTYWAGFSGTTLLSGLNNHEIPAWIFTFGFIALLAGTGYAASLFPFHFWTPDTFQGAPVSIAAYLSVTPKIGAFFALAQVARDLPAGIVDWQLIIAITAALSMTFGNVVALMQQNVVRLLAYSTIAQAGYFMLAVVALPQSNLAIHALVVFGAAYLVMNAGAFAIVLAYGKTIDQLGGLGHKRPGAAVALSLFLLSLVGIPPLAGFAGKFLLFGAALDAGYTWLAVVAIVNSVISLAVYLRVLVPVFFRHDHVLVQPQQHPAIQWVWGICMLLTVLLGIFVRVLM